MLVHGMCMGVWCWFTWIGEAELGVGSGGGGGEVFKITKYKHLIPTYCFFFAIRLCSERQNTSLNHKT